MTGDRVSLRWEADPERPRGWGKGEEGARSRGSSPQRSRQLPRSLAAGEQCLQLKPHGGWEQEGDLESQDPWVIQIASFNHNNKKST